MMIRAILYPGAHLFSTAGGKEQASQILMEKISDICTKIPTFKKEINWNRGATKESKDSCKYIFKNGSIIENLAARESSRGRRFHAGIIEECVGVDQKMLQEIVIPTMNVSRRCMSGEVVEDEALNQAQLYIDFLVISVVLLYSKYSVTSNTLYIILQKKSYQDYWCDYQKITEEQKLQLVSLLRNWQK